MENIAIIENFIDLSYMVMLFLAAQFEKKFDLFGKIIKRGVSDTIKVAFIGAIHAGVWIWFFHPADITIWAHVKIIITSYLATVVLYDYMIKKFMERFKPKE